MDMLDILCEAAQSLSSVPIDGRNHRSLKEATSSAEKGASGRMPMRPLNAMSKKQRDRFDQIQVTKLLFFIFFTLDFRKVFFYVIRMHEVVRTA